MHTVGCIVGCVGIGVRIGCIEGVALSEGTLLGAPEGPRLAEGDTEIVEFKETEGIAEGNEVVTGLGVPVGTTMGVGEGDAFNRSAGCGAINSRRCCHWNNDYRAQEHSCNKKRAKVYLFKHCLHISLCFLDPRMAYRFVSVCRNLRRTPPLEVTRIHCFFPCFASETFHERNGRREWGALAAGENPSSRPTPHLKSHVVPTFSPTLKLFSVAFVLQVLVHEI